MAPYQVAVVTEAHHDKASTLVSWERLSLEWANLTVMAFCIVAVYLLRFNVQRRLLTRLGEYLCPALIDARKRKLLWLETSWYLVHQGVSFLLGAVVYIYEDWSVLPTWNLWYNWPLQELSVGMHIYYLTTMTFYCNAFWYLPSIPFRRRYKQELVLSHMITIALIVFSYFTRTYRVHFVVLMSLCLSDVFLNISKCCRYLGYDWLVNPSFVVFSAVFFMARLVFLSVVIVPSCFIEGWFVRPAIPFVLVMPVFLIGLQFIYIMWFFLIAKSLRRAVISHSKVDDIYAECKDSDSYTSDTDTSEAESSDGEPDSSQTAELARTAARGTLSFQARKYVVDFIMNRLLLPEEEDGVAHHAYSAHPQSTRRSTPLSSHGLTQRQRARPHAHTHANTRHSPRRSPRHS